MRDLLQEKSQVQKQQTLLNGLQMQQQSIKVTSKDVLDAEKCYMRWGFLMFRIPRDSSALQILEGCSFYITHKAKKLQNCDILIIVKWIQPYIHCQNLPFKINTLQKKRLVFKWIYLVCKALHDCNQELKVIFEALLMAVMGMLHTKENWIRIIHAKLLRLLWQIGYDDHVCRTVARHCKCIGKA